MPYGFRQYALVSVLHPILLLTFAFKSSDGTSPAQSQDETQTQAGERPFRHPNGSSSEIVLETAVNTAV
jgi:hypothetical protein